VAVGVYSVVCNLAHLFGSATLLSTVIGKSIKGHQEMNTGLANTFDTDGSQTVAFLSTVNLMLKTRHLSFRFAPSIFTNFWP